jgi:flagellar motor switch protein FliG
MTSMSPETALHNAAALMTLLGPTEALAAFRTLSPEAAKTLRNAMGDAAERAPRSTAGVDIQMPLPAVAQSQLSTDAGHYIRSLLKVALSDEDTPVSAHAILHKSELKQPQRHYGVINPVEKPSHDALDDGSGIEKLKTWSAPAIADLLTSEHPQIIAAILVQVGTNLAAGVLNNLPQRLCQQVVPRIAGLQGIKSAALRDLNEGLLVALDGRGKAQFSLPGGVTVAADTMRMMDTSLTGSVLDSLRQQDPDLAQRLVQRMTNSTSTAD